MTEMPCVHIVDDEEPVRRSIAFLLKTSGYSVQLWDSGAAFLREVRQAAEGCVLLDIRMPGTDGLEVQEKLSELGITLPVVILTGHGDVAQAVRAMRAGAVDFLEKPFEREKLLQSIESALAQLRDAAGRRDQRKNAQAQIAALTVREREVLAGLACGYPNKTIAFDLGISPRTVEVYRAGLMSKMQARSLPDLVRMVMDIDLA